MLIITRGAALLAKVLSFYRDGFRNMRLGRTLWTIILIKLLVLFTVLKLFFFPDVLQVNYDNDAARADHVLRRLTQSGAAFESNPRRE